MHMLQHKIFKCCAYLKVVAQRSRLKAPWPCSSSAIDRSRPMQMHGRVLSMFRFFKISLESSLGIHNTVNYEAVIPDVGAGPSGLK
jgi:hypothetical protein